MSESKIREMARNHAKTPTMHVGTVEERMEEAFLIGALFALQEAANDLLRKDMPHPGGYRANRAYASWLRERASSAVDG